MKVNIDEMQKEMHYGWTSSKGNQNKWRIDGIWYKEDGLGYEALAEVLVSKLLGKTNTGAYVEYEYEPIEIDGRTVHGCKSRDFMFPEDDKIISVERLFQTYRGESAAKAILEYTETEDRIKYVTETVEKITGADFFRGYLKKTLTIDALFLNEDRHFHNLAVILRNDGTYRECPVFDNGAALFSDTRGDYPLNHSLEQCFDTIQAKPFSTDFDLQLDACDMLGGEYRFQAWFTMEDVEKILQEFQGVYEDRILIRVQETIRMQMRKYAYLFFTL